MSYRRKEVAKMVVYIALGMLIDYVLYYALTYHHLPPWMNWL